MLYDLVIVGGGVSALTAAIYAGRKKLHTAVVAEEIGGQIALQPEVVNYPGYMGSDGYQLVKDMKGQVSKLEAITFLEPFRAVGVVEEQRDGKTVFIVKNEGGKRVEGRAVLIATGGHPKKLGVPGEKEFYNKGVTYCATCDAPLFQGKRTVVIGGGNTGTEAALLLARYSPRVYLLHRRDMLKADEVTKVKLAAEKDRIEVILNAQTTEIIGKDGKVTGLKYKDIVSGAERPLDIEGVFVAIGFAPNSDLAKDLVALNDFGEIVVDPKTNMTSRAGIFAAGDVTDIPYKQAVIAAGEASKAALAASRWLLGQK